MELSPSPFFVFQRIIRQKKNIFSGFKSNGFIKIAYLGLDYDDTQCIVFVCIVLFSFEFKREQISKITYSFI